MKIKARFVVVILEAIYKQLIRSCCAPISLL